MLGPAVRAGRVSHARKLVMCDGRFQPGATQLYYIYIYISWKTNMEPENPWLVEENSLSWDHCQGLC